MRGRFLIIHRQRDNQRYLRWMGLRFVGIERDANTFDAACNRIETNLRAAPAVRGRKVVGAGDTAVQGDMLCLPTQKSAAPARQSAGSAGIIRLATIRVTMLELDKIHCGDNCDLLGQLPRECD